MPSLNPSLSGNLFGLPVVLPATDATARLPRGGQETFDASPTMSVFHAPPLALDDHIFGDVLRQIGSLTATIHARSFALTSGLQPVSLTPQLKLVSNPLINCTDFECPIELERIQPATDAAVWLPRGGENESYWNAKFKDLHSEELSEKRYQPFKLTEGFERYVINRQRDPITNKNLTENDILIQTNPGNWSSPFLINSKFQIL